MNGLFCNHVQDYFVSYLMARRGYGKNTLCSYRDTFKLLILFLMENGFELHNVSLPMIARPVVEAFLEWLEEERGNSIATRNVRLAHLKSFFGYVLSVSPENAGICSAAMNVQPKKAPKSPPDSLTRQEIRLLLHAPGFDEPDGLRNTTMLSLLYDTACRAQELVDLDACGVSASGQCSVHLKGKGEKHRDVPLFKETRKLVDDYVREHELLPTSPLFVNRRGLRLTRAGISYVVEKYWSRVYEAHPETVIHGKVKPHLLRHSKATHLVEEGVNIYYIRDFLGHASVETTQVCLKGDPEVLRKALESVSAESVAPNSGYYTRGRKVELLRFLNALT